MKLFKIKTEDGQLDYMVKLETMFERVMYDIASEYDDETFRAFNNAMKCELNVDDNEVAYYFNVGGEEQGPEVGETFELDGIKWKIVA